MAETMKIIDTEKCKAFFVSTGNRRFPLDFQVFILKVYDKNYGSK